MSSFDEIIEELGRQLGLTGRAAVSGVAGMGAAFANPIAYTANRGFEAMGSDYRFPEQHEAIMNVMNEMGVPQPEGTTEKVVGFLSEMGVPDPSDSAKVVSALMHTIDPSMAHLIPGAAYMKRMNQDPESDEANEFREKMIAAQKAQREGMPSDQLTAETGLLQAPVGGRDELFAHIPGGKEYMKLPMDYEQPGVHRLGDVYENTELYAFDPKLADVEVEFDPNMSSMGSALENRIKVNPKYDVDEVGDTVGHEVEHVLQSRYGMPRGGNPSMFTKPHTDQQTSQDIWFGMNGGVFDQLENSPDPVTKAKAMLDDMKESYMALVKDPDVADTQLQDITAARKFMNHVYMTMKHNQSQGMDPKSAIPDLLRQFDHITRPEYDYHRMWGEAAARIAGKENTGASEDAVITDLTDALMDEAAVYRPDMLIERSNRGNLSNYDAAKTPGLESGTSRLTQIPEDDGITLSNYVYNHMPDATKTTSVKNFAKELQQRAENYWDGPIEFTEENIEKLADNMFKETFDVYKTRPDIAEWYAANLEEAIGHAAKLYPEIATDPNARNAFLFAKAMTSNGQKVVENTKWTRKVYEEFRKTGRFPDFGTGKETNAMKKAFSGANAIIDHRGMDGFIEFLHAPVTVRELKQAGFNVSKENMDTALHGSAVFGPKVGGGFFQNLSGNFNPVTFDLWWTRTWGRHTGTMFLDPSKQREALRKIAREDPRFDAKALEDDDAIDNLAKTLNAEFANGGYKDKSPINNAARNLKVRLDPVADPGSGSNRNMMRDVVGRVKQRFEQQGVELNNASIQALLWYLEKDLYRKAGVRGPKDELNDYAEAWRRQVEG